MEETKGRLKLEAVLENHTEDEAVITIETELFDGEQVIYQNTRKICSKKGETEYLTETELDAVRPGQQNSLLCTDWSSL